MASPWQVARIRVHDWSPEPNSSSIYGHAGADRWAHLVAVVLFEHPGAQVAELVGDLLKRDPGVRQERGGRCLANSSSTSAQGRPAR